MINHLDKKYSLDIEWVQCFNMFQIQTNRPFWITEHSLILKIKKGLNLVPAFNMYRQKSPLAPLQSNFIIFKQIFTKRIDVKAI